MDHQHQADAGCPLCPPPSAQAIRREQFKSRAELRRARLLAEIASEPASFIHIVEAFDVESKLEATVMHVASSVELARTFCSNFDLSKGQGFEIRPFRINDNDKMNGTVVLAHYVRVDGATIIGDGRYYP